LNKKKTYRPDENLMIIIATELFAKKHNISAKDAFAFFQKKGLDKLIRKHYGALHTQPLEEAYYFVEDVLNRKKQVAL